MRDNKTKEYLQARSTHTFAWPFTFETDCEEFRAKLLGKGWQKKNLDFRKAEEDRATLQECFMLEQYMSTSARKLFLEEASYCCEVLEYPMDEKDECRYCIETMDWSKSRTVKAEYKKTYNLTIDAIELHVYKYGMGILFLRTLNMDPKTTIEDIKRINDKGRSISLPFLPDDGDGYILCAESLKISFGECEYVADFRGDIRRFYEKNGKCVGNDDVNQGRTCAESCGEEKSVVRAELLEQLSKSAHFLKYILNVNLDDGKEEEYSKENDIEVTPTSDYRMFVFCIVRDGELSAKICDRENRNCEEFEKELYSILYVDAGNPSCQNQEMRHDLLEGASYLRWADLGTFYGATDYSFFCITSDLSNVNDNVVLPFYTEYIYMVSLVLAQRVALMNFSVRADVIADLLHKKESIFARWFKTSAKRFVELQEDYIVLKNRMMILEFSNQEQGIELYKLLQKQLLVEQEKEILDEQLQGLYDVVNTRNSASNEWWGLFWAVVAIILSLNFTGIKLPWK